MKDIEQRFQKIISKIKEPVVQKKYKSFKTSSSFTGPSIPGWLNGKTLYEVYLRSFSPQGTFSVLTSKLADLKKSGFDFIWLMPIFPIGITDKKGGLGCPYAVRNYYTVNPEYGTEKDFRELIETAHTLDMKVIIDMVANHVSPDYNSIKNYPEIVKRNKSGNPLRKVADWTDIVDLDYSNPDTRNHMKDVMLYWAKNYNIDGYRCDVAGMVPLDFWEEVIEEIRSIKKDFYMLAEWDGPHMNEKVFHSTYDWVLYELMELVKDGQESAHILFEWLEIQNAIYPSNALPMRFLENHDKPRAKKIFGADSQVPFLVFIFSMYGVPLVYNGQEIGSDDYLSLFDKAEINWQSGNKNLENIYKQLIRLRKMNDAFYSKSLIQHIHNKIPDVLMYEKAGSEDFLFILNTKNETQIVNCDKSICAKIKKGQQVFNTHESINKNYTHLSLHAYQCVIYKIKKELA